MPDVRELLADPDFRALPPQEQIKGLAEYDPDFARLPKTEQLKALQPAEAEQAGNLYSPLTAAKRFVKDIIKPEGVTTAGQAIMAPLVRPSLLLPTDEEIQAQYKDLPGWMSMGNRLGGAAARGPLEVAEGFTAPLNLVFLGGLRGLTALSKVPSAYARTAARLMDVGLDAYFATAQARRYSIRRRASNRPGSKRTTRRC